MQLRDHGAIVLDDLNAVAGGSGITAGAAVDVRGDHAETDAPSAAGGPSERNLLHLSHCTSVCFFRTSSYTMGRIRTWHSVQRSSFACATATPRRPFAT